MEDRHLISVDELRAAGALDVPASWRTSLDDEEEVYDLFSNLTDDDEPLPEEQQATTHDPNCDAPEDECE